MDQEVGNILLRVAYWDYAGEDRFRSLFPGYCQGSTAAIVCFDTSRLQTMAELPEWLRMIRQHNAPDIPIIMVGNKIDTLTINDRNLITESTGNFVKVEKLSGFYLTSAKDGNGMEAPFAHLGILIVEDKKKKGEI